jgi:hypothetical protein
MSRIAESTMLKSDQLKVTAALLFFCLFSFTAQTQVTLNFESGIYFVTIEDVSDGGQGDIISYPNDFGITRLPNLRAGIKWQINEKHIIYGKAVIFQFNKTAELDEPKEYEGYLFPAGEPIDLDYKFNGYRFGYTYCFLREKDVEAGVGLTLNIRQGLIRFTDGDEVREFSRDPVPLVPLINYFTYYTPVDWFAVHGEAEFFYFTPDGWVTDVMVAAVFKPARWINLYTGYRGYGGNG